MKGVRVKGGRIRAMVALGVRREEWVKIGKWREVFIRDSRLSGATYVWVWCGYPTASPKTYRLKHDGTCMAVDWKDAR